MEDWITKFQDWKKKLDQVATDAEQEYDTIAAGTMRYIEPEMSEEEALEKAARERSLAEGVGTSVGSITKAAGKVLRSPMSAGLKRAREAMTKPNPAAQKKLAEELSGITKEPLKLRTGEVIYPREVLQNFQKSIK